MAATLSIAADRPLRIAIAGIGALGAGLARQARETDGLRLVLMADSRRARAENGAEAAGLPTRLTDSCAEVHRAICCGQVALCQDLHLAAACEAADVLVLADLPPAEAAILAEAALVAGTHVVMTDPSADLAYGAWLLDIARAGDLGYALQDGGAAGALWALNRRLAGHGLVPQVAGILRADPPQHREKSVLGCLSNALGGIARRDPLDLDSVDELLHLPQTDADDALGLLTATHPDAAPAVFVRALAPDGTTCPGLTPDAQRDRHQLYHVPVPAGAAAILDTARALPAAAPGTMLAPWFGSRSALVAFAARDLVAGERLDGVQGKAAFGCTETLDGQTEYAMDEGLPLVLCDGLTLKRPMAAGQRIRLADCIYSERDPRFALWRKARHCPAVCGTALAAE
ncbi:hypothetical protein VK792_13260 [Mesobacterium sp. TK19101]|uniref:Homoserine dehydrogenase n=1 Tax=Mesobacterium hydrothermale TaxID=3111907 RepID=A0ABU6HIU0_9RHOB|nr:hypothetical protein [Mesobacterium sp. TK19101]MEC3862256.1 hypothetical protein [Mesobacterium sp. TK19101]